jgi:hypothetical protein
LSECQIHPEGSSTFWSERQSDGLGRMAPAPRFEGVLRDETVEVSTVRPEAVTQSEGQARSSSARLSSAAIYVSYFDRSTDNHAPCECAVNRPRTYACLRHPCRRNVVKMSRNKSDKVVAETARVRRISMSHRRALMAGCGRNVSGDLILKLGR